MVRKMIDQIKKVIFIHIPRTSGESITRLFDFHTDHLGIGDGKHDNFKIMSKEIDNINDYYLFTSIRSPYTRIVSLFNRIKFKSKKLDISFRDWLDFLVEYFEYIPDDRGIDPIYNEKYSQHLGIGTGHRWLFNPQKSWIKGGEEKIKIFKMENFDKNIKQILKDTKLNIRQKYLTSNGYSICENSSQFFYKNKTDIFEFKNIDDKSLEKIYNLYREDFDFFGYEK